MTISISEEENEVRRREKISCLGVFTCRFCLSAMGAFIRHGEEEDASRFFITKCRVSSHGFFRVDDDDAGWLRSKEKKGDKDDEVLGMKMTKKVLRCEGEGERKGEVCWEKTNRRKRTENVRMSEKGDSLFVCEQAESVLFVCLFVILLL